MKLTKQKLEQLIMEEFTRRISDEVKPTNYPEYTDKLTRLAKYDYPQARELADTLDEPLNIELSPDEMETKPYVSDNDRIRTFRKWMVSKGYGPQIRRILQAPDREGADSERIFKEYIDETKNYRVYNAVLGAYRVEHIPFLDEETGEPLPLGSPRPFRVTNTYHYPRP